MKRGCLLHFLDRLVHHDKWVIGLVKMDSVHLERGELPSPVQWLAPRFGQFIADPFLFTHNDTDYLLYELFTYSTGYGKIAIAELVKDEGGRYRLHNEQCIINEPFHQSYPFVFSFKDDIYCMPEQAESNSLRLYRATDFPSTWILEDILIDEFPVVDPTLFWHNSRWWLFATRGEGRHDSDLYAWHSDDFHGPWQPHDHNPIKVGLGKVRPAGPIFTAGHHLYRPVQGFYKRYGDAGLRIEKILELTPSTFCEETVASINPFSLYPKGLHHVCMGKTLAVVDGNRFASPLEIVIKLIGIMRKKRTAGRG